MASLDIFWTCLCVLVGVLDWVLWFFICPWMFYMREKIIRGIFFVVCSIACFAVIIKPGIRQCSCLSKEMDWKGRVVELVLQNVVGLFVLTLDPITLENIICDIFICLSLMCLVRTLRPVSDLGLVISYFSITMFRGFTLYHPFRDYRGWLIAIPIFSACILHCYLDQKPVQQPRPQNTEEATTVRSDSDELRTPLLPSSTSGNHGGSGSAPQQEPSTSGNKEDVVLPDQSADAGGG